MVQLAPESSAPKEGIFPFGSSKKFGVKSPSVWAWGALRPLIAAALAAVPFLFLDNTSTANIDEESNGGSSKSRWPSPSSCGLDSISGQSLTPGGTPSQSWGASGPELITNWNGTVSQACQVSAVVVIKIAW